MNHLYERNLSTEKAMSIAEDALSHFNIRAMDEAYGLELQT